MLLIVNAFLPGFFAGTESCVYKNKGFIFMFLLSAWLFFSLSILMGALSFVNSRRALEEVL